MRESISEEAAREVVRLWDRTVKKWECLSPSFRSASPIRAYVEFLGQITKRLFGGKTWTVDREGSVFRVREWPFTDENPMEVPDDVPEPVTPNPGGGSDEQAEANPGRRMQLRLLAKLQALCV